MDLSTAIVYFLFYSFLGWILDTLYRSVSDGRWTTVTFLPIPCCPIYGVGAVFVLWLARYVEAWPWLGQWAVYGLSLAVFELAAGLALLAFFGKRLWGYPKGATNIATFTDLPHAALWGAMAIAVVLLHPWIEAALIRVVSGFLY